MWMNKAPCPQAIIDEELSIKFVNPWDYENEGIRVWVIALETLEDLLQFQKDLEGVDLILHKNLTHALNDLPIPAIEIYDGWRE